MSLIVSSMQKIKILMAELLHIFAFTYLCKLESQFQFDFKIQPGWMNRLYENNLMIG